MLLATICPGCDRPAPPAAGVCDGCRQQLRPAPSLPPPPAVDVLVALLAYEGVGREVVARIKYRNHRVPVGWLAADLATQVRRVVGVVADVATPVVVTWAPTTVPHRRRRSFDQAELLARAVAGRLGRPCVRLLDRAPGASQTGRSAAERRAAPPAFTPRADLTGTAVVLVDDVVTSGATLTAAATALRSAGASAVIGAAAARTPRPGG